MSKGFACPVAVSDMTMPTASVYTNNPWLGLYVIVPYGDDAKINQFNFVNFQVTLYFSKLHTPKPPNNLSYNLREEYLG